MNKLNFFIDINDSFSVYNLVRPMVLSSVLIKCPMSNLKALLFAQKFLDRLGFFNFYISMVYLAISI